MIGRVDEIRQLVLEPYEEDRRLALLNDACRVYASAFVDDAFVLGDAYGYLHAHKPDGSHAWELFCGSTIGGIDRSPDGRKLAVSTAAGYLQFSIVGGKHLHQSDDYIVALVPKNEVPTVARALAERDR
jgi:hypothetical protein